MIYTDWLKQWLESYIRSSVKVRIYERYRLIIEQHIRDKIVDMELNGLFLLVLQRFIIEFCRIVIKRRVKAYLQISFGKAV